MTSTGESRPQSPARVAGKGDSCPTCSVALIPIVYGLPLPELFQEAERGDVELGGCCFMEGRPQLRCRGPKPHYWRREEDGHLVECAR